MSVDEFSFLVLHAFADFLKVLITRLPSCMVSSVSPPKLSSIASWKKMNRHLSILLLFSWRLLASLGFSSSLLLLLSFSSSSFRSSSTSLLPSPALLAPYLLRGDTDSLIVKLQPAVIRLEERVVMPTANISPMNQNTKKVLRKVEQDSLLVLVHTQRDGRLSLVSWLSGFPLRRFRFQESDFLFGNRPF